MFEPGTGYTPRPHLHVHVVGGEDGDYWNGKGVPVKKDLVQLIKMVLCAKELL